MLMQVWACARHLGAGGDGSGGPAAARALLARRWAAFRAHAPWLGKPKNAPSAQGLLSLALFLKDRYPDVAALDAAPAAGDDEFLAMLQNTCADQSPDNIGVIAQGELYAAAATGKKTPSAAA